MQLSQVVSFALLVSVAVGCGSAPSPSRIDAAIAAPAASPTVSPSGRQGEAVVLAEPTPGVAATRQSSDPSEPACPSLQDGVAFHFQTPVPPVTEETAITLSSSELLATALSRWPQVHQQWTGRQMQVHGTVTGITYALDGCECVQLGGDDGESDVSLECVVPRGSWQGCGAGQTATVCGYWDPYALSPRLLSAQIVKVTGDSAAVDMTADDFLEAIADDFETARASFQNQYLMLQGSILAIEPHVPAVAGITAENAANAYLRIAEFNGLVLDLLASDRPGTIVFADRNLQVGDSIVAAFPIKDLANQRFGNERIVIANAVVALRVDGLAGPSASASPRVPDSEGDPVYRMTSAEFAAMCAQHQRERRTVISSATYEITGRMHRSDPFLSLNIRLDDGIDHVGGVKCYLQTGGNWTVAFPGQMVTLRGRLFPTGTITDSLLDCRIVEVSDCPIVYSLDELATLVMGSGKVNGDLHMLGVAVTGFLGQTAKHEWQLLPLTADSEAPVVRLEFAAEYHAAGSQPQTQVTLHGKIMRDGDYAFYLNDCMLVPDRTDSSIPEVAVPVSSPGPVAVPTQ